MSFGSGGFGSSGFGSTNNNTTGGLFGSGSGGGGFGSNNNSNTGGGFGTTSTGFGSTTNNTSTGFGGFGGASNNNTFGAAKPATAFGTNTSSLFGSGNNNASTSGFGGSSFGGTTANNTSTGFGSTNNSSSLFGSKPASTFGNTGSSLFGGGGSTFGSNSTTTSTPFGGAVANNLGECQGTANPQYSVTTEKEANSNITNNFQSIVHMPNYQKWSFEELRLADYNAGRRFANASGQAGGFGTSTGFGGFSNNTNNQANSNPFGAANNTTTSGGLFGAVNNNTGTGFGANNTTSTGFSAFGQNKPATTGGLFGTNNNATTNTGGSLFGGGTSGGFGTNNNTSTGFGQNNTSTGFGNNAAKPSLFGSTTTNTSGGLFGNNNATTNSSGLFGNNQSQNTGFGNTAAATTSNPFGGSTANTGGGLFGAANNQPKPGGLFGSTATTNTTGSLFGNTQQNNTTGGGLFGAANNTNNSGTLFGNKPATTSLFGQPQQQQPAQTTGLFGNTQSQPAQGSLFGNNAQKPTGSLFGTSITQPATQGNSLFGNPQPQAQGSLFGPTQSIQPPQGLQASIMDTRPYGSVSIFDGLPPPPTQNVGPIATPISSGQKARKPAVLPQWKLNPTMSPRFVTPQKQGYGFSYSRYGTPSSVSSVASTPGHFGGSLLGSSVGRNIGKSVSVSNLRRNYNDDAESVLAPGAFTSSARLNGGHSLKKLNIDRSLRNDLFAPVTQGSVSNDRGDQRGGSALKKRVSFEASSVHADGPDDDVPRITNTESSPTPTAEEQGYLRSSTSRNLFNGQPSTLRHSQETSPVKGNELTVVPEDGSPEAPRQAQAPSSRAGGGSSRPGDPEPGNYWTRPVLDEIKKMTPAQLKKVPDFVVGRENVGQCAFQQTVDLSAVDWNNFFDVMVKFDMRSICVYPDQTKKPPVGMGINVPSIITLKNCWPRSRHVRSGPRLDKHIKHLQNVVDCEFIRYNVDNGEWTFRVPHFTTYGLDYENDEMDVEPDFGSSILSEAFSEAAPAFLEATSEDTPTRNSAASCSSSDAEETTPEDTFGFRGIKQVPGGFDAISVSDDEALEMEQINHNALAFLDQRSAVQESEDEDEPSDLPQGEPNEEQALVVRDENMDLEMAGAFPDEQPNHLKSILKHNTFEDEDDDKPGLFLGDDWAEQLQRTISPRKRDRQNLRTSQAMLFRDADSGLIQSPTQKGKTDNVRFETTIDVMKSLFGKEDLRRSTAEGQKQVTKQAFQWPYSKDVDRNANELNEIDQAFHDSFKPHWGPGDVLIHAITDNVTHMNGGRIRGPDMNITGYLASEGYDVRLSKFTVSKQLNPACYDRQFNRSKIEIQNGLPFARPLKSPLRVEDKNTVNSEEALIWRLASILFDSHNDNAYKQLSTDQKATLASRIQKERLSQFWSSICKDEALHAVGSSQTAEERAVHFLSMGAVVDACNALTNGKDFRLATLISQIGGDRIIHEDMAQQIKEWRRLNVLSEMSDSIRTLYELLSGNTCLCEGRQGAIEDRAGSFVISQRYKLSWTRAFGLRLWYAIGDGEPFEIAVKKYITDLNGSELAKPKPWFLEKDGYHPPWTDPKPELREDVLWGLLRLSADRNDPDSSTRLTDVVSPENVCGNPIDYRLSWELYFALLPYLPNQESSQEADKLTIAFAAELESANHWTWAIFILLHLTNSDQRQAAIRDILARQAAAINVDDPQTQESLFHKFQIPQPWVFEAKALFARAVQHDRLTELHYLQRAGNWNEAHAVLCSTVAPRAIIERDHEMLSQVLAQFEDGEKPHTWRTGGAVYSDYLALLLTKDKEQRAHLLKKLLKSVPDMAHSHSSIHKKHKGTGTSEKGSESEGFLKSVAVKEMGWVIGDMVLRNRSNDHEHGLVLHLPLSDEMKRERSQELGMEYYRKVMATGS